MGADKFFEEKTWKRLFAQDENTAAEYARESAAAAADSNTYRARLP
jgi:hypothetical protein